MEDIRIKIKTKSRLGNGLLTMGIPFGAGSFFPNNNIELTHEGAILPLWWRVSSYWPGGSIKWIFLHTRVPEGEREIRLRICGDDGGALDAADMSKCSFCSLYEEDGSITLNIEDTGLTINGSKWTFRTPDGSWGLDGDTTESDLEIPAGGVKYEVTLAEDSPIAPLIRIKPVGNTDGLITDQLLRVDPMGRRLIWSRRITWNREGKYWLTASEAYLKAGPGFRDSPPASILIPEPGRVRYNGQDESKGYPEGRIDREGYSIWVGKAWQRAPVGISDQGGRVRLSFYPAETEKLGVIGGTSFRHTVHLCCGDKSAAAAGHEVEFVIDPGYICATGALGQIIPESRDGNRKSFPGFEVSFRTALDGGRFDRLSTAEHGKGSPVPLREEERQGRDYFGLQHYGDWPLNWNQYGSNGRRAYADNEYDVAYVYFQGYAVFGKWDYLDAARWAAIHMADVDCISTTGDMRYHGYGENAEDHSHARTGRGDFGHYWTDGFWTEYFLLGDVWAKESAEALSRYISGCFSRGGENFLRKVWAVCERNLGWPLVALTATYEATGDASALESIRSIVEFIGKFTSDPDSEIEKEAGTPEEPLIWWRTAMEDGCKPFMVGIIMEGLERYHRITGDESAARALLNLSAFLVEHMWHPHQGDFTYEFNAFGRGHRDINAQQLIPLFLRGLGYAYAISGNEKYREVSEKAFHACLWTLFDTNAGGKEIGIIGRTLGAYVSMMKEWMENDRKSYMDSLEPSDGVDFQWEGGIKGLAGSGWIQLEKGKPQYRSEALIAEKDSFLAARFKEPVCSDSGEVEFRVKLGRGSTTYLNQRAYIHLCDEVHTKSCLSVITFYTNLSVRIYDNNRKLIETLDGYIQDTDANRKPVEKAAYPVWKEEEWHSVRIVWEAPGTAVLYMDGMEADRRILDRPIGGRFTRLHLGYKPGNWKLDGEIELKVLKCGLIRKP